MAGVQELIFLFSTKTYFLNTQKYNISMRQFFITPAFSLEKKDILILYQSPSIVRLSIHPSVCPSVTFLVNVSPPTPSNFVPS